MVHGPKGEINNPTVNLAACSYFVYFPVYLFALFLTLFLQYCLYILAITLLR